MKIRMKIIVEILFILLIVIYVFRYSLQDVLSFVFYREYTLPEFTVEQKVEDFENFYNNICESVPYLDEISKVYGIDFAERKQYYLDAVKATKSNIEYYGVMKAISKDLASFHIDICFPLYSNLENLNCYAADDVLHQLGMKAKVESWYREFEKEAQRYENVNLFSVRYIDGSYILNEGWLSEQYKSQAYYELLSVNGITANQFVIENLSIYALKYDGLNETPYRESYLFNDSIGEEVQVVWRDLEGRKKEQTLYIHKGVEVAASYGYLVSERYEYYETESEDVIVTMCDDENELEYIKINNFTNGKGEFLKEYLQNLKYDKVVIDLRKNYGGQKNYAKEYLFPALYDSDTSFEYAWKVPDSELNKKMTNLLATRFLYYRKNDGGYCYYSDSIKYEGKAKMDKKVYYLVGPETGSAADAYIAMIKENHMGIIVGNNTGGEGLGASYICDNLKNTCLIYVYYPSIPILDNTEQSSCVGTAPDIYVNQSVEKYMIFNEMRKNGNSLQYENQLKYDEALKWVIQQ